MPINKGITFNEAAAWDAAYRQPGHYREGTSPLDLIYQNHSWGCTITLYQQGKAYIVRRSEGTAKPAWERRFSNRVDAEVCYRRASAEARQGARP